MIVNLAAELIYVLLSMLVVVGIAVQALMLKANDGRMPDSPLLYWLSTLDLLWLAASAAAMYFLEFNALLISVPVVYCIYVVLSFFYGASQIDADALPEWPEDVVVSMDYIRFGLSFACVFLLWCGVLVTSSLSANVDSIQALLMWLRTLFGY